MQSIAVLAPFVLLAFLVACGGGGGSTTASIPGGNPANSAPIGATTAPIAGSSPSSSPSPGATSTAHSVVPPSNAPGPISTVAPTPTPSPSSLVYVSNTDGTTMQILAFSTNTGGNIAPVKRIAGSATQLNYPNSLAFDSSGNLYVANETGYGTNTPSASITVYAKGSNGDVAPIRVISGANTGFNNVRGLGGLAVDANGYLYVVVNVGSTTPSGYQSYNCANYNYQHIWVFPPDANGNIAPVSTINGSDCFAGVGVVVAPSGNIEVSGTELNNTGVYGPEIVAVGQILIYAPAASGNATPLSTINGTHGGFGAIARSPAGMLYVTAHPQWGAVLGYPETANGGPSPAVYLTDGGNTNWSPEGLAEDSNAVLYVLNVSSSSPQIQEFSSTANNADLPIFTVSGPNTDLLICNPGPCPPGDVAIGPP
jgi:hypothetical protein